VRVKRKAILAMLATGVVLLVASGSASSQRSVTGGRYRVLPLATLPSLGTVYCRSDVSVGSERFALGLCLFPEDQSAGARFRAGKLTVDRTFDDPATVADVTRWFRFHRAQVEWLAAVAGGENGYTLGFVRADFSSGGCEFYEPPA
jgi:hypothetical protein